MMPDRSGPTRECPLCGGTMQLKATESTVHVPGNPNATKRVSSEWVCPDCDYFEDDDLEG
jgi:C4-type Zn-finger protein